MITPQEAKKKTEPSKEVIKQLEKIIDEAILKQFKEGNDHIYIDGNIFPNTPTRLAIMRMYQNSGWKVTYEDDQREGNYMYLHTRSEPFSLSEMYNDRLSGGNIISQFDR